MFNYISTYVKKILDNLVIKIFIISYKLPLVFVKINKLLKAEI